jgi:hypothetical protein
MNLTEVEECRRLALLGMEMAADEFCVSIKECRKAADEQRRVDAVFDFARDACLGLTKLSGPLPLEALAEIRDRMPLTWMVACRHGNLRLEDGTFHVEVT